MLFPFPAYFDDDNDDDDDDDQTIYITWSFKELF